MNQKQTINKLEICIYNLENFFIKDAFENPPNINYFKSQLNLNQLKQVFNEINADIYALTEVGQIQSLEYFNESYLDEAYDIFHQQGNSDRGIENAFLVRKGLALNYEHLSHTTKEINFQLHDEDELEYFLSRDFSHLRVYNEDKNHILSIFNVHLKSQRDDSGHDFRSVRRRKAELELLIDVYNKEKEIFPTTPILLGGDFNGNASNENTDDEFKKIYEETDLIDVLGILDLPLQYRTTFYQFKGHTSHQLQLDYLFIDKSFETHLMDAAVYRYKNSIGKTIPPPKRRADIWNNPSDHYPLVALLEIK